MASEVGVLDIAPQDVLQKALAPGKMFMVDTSLNRVIFDNEIRPQSHAVNHMPRLENNRSN